MGALISYENLADDATITNSSDGSNVLAVTRVQERQIGKVFRQTLTSASPLQSVKLDFDLGASKSISYVGIFGHSITDGTYAVDLGTSSGASDVASASGALWQGVADDPKNQHVIFNEAHSARFVRITLTPTLATASPLPTLDCDVGRIWIDDPWTPKVGISFEHTVVDPSATERSIGQSAYSWRKPRYRTCRIDFRYLTEAEALGSSSSASVRSAHHMDMTVGTPVKCIHCGSDRAVKNGSNRMRCNSCGKSFNRGAKPIQEASALREAELLAKINRLQQQNNELRQEAADTAKIRRFIHRLGSKQESVPAWLRGAPKHKKRGTPTLFLSDLHWGERVYANQVNGVNRYDLGIARERLQRITETAMSLLLDELARPDYPGIICALGGDIVSGNIHEELRESNDAPVLEQCADAEKHLGQVIATLADEFGRVFVPCVVGNHGRLDRKPRAKNGVKDNLEWIIYEFLRKRFEDDNRVTVIVPTAFDCLYAVHGHRYLMTHGDQFKGGTGITGPLLPWKRGDQKKRQAYGAVDQSYDTLIMGHWHQAAMLPGTIIVNGSLKGWDEYSFRMGFEFQPPQQTLWITDPKHGIWYWQPVDAEDQPNAEKREWITVAA